MDGIALLVLVNVPPAEWGFAVGATRQLIGRSADAQIPIPASHLSVSRRHANIWHDQRGSWLCDLGSRGGTRVNGIWLKANQPAGIVIGDRLTLGAAELRLEPGVCLAENEPAGEPSESSPSRRVETVVQLPKALLARQFLERLTCAEHNIVLWMSRGYVHDDDICQLLHRSRNTIRTQMASILKKLELHSRISVLSELQRERTTIDKSRAERDEKHP